MNVDAYSPSLSGVGAEGQWASKLGLTKLEDELGLRRLGDEGLYDGCSLGCPDQWLNDGTCDAPCNVEACSYDDRDCFRNAGECWTEADGSDYRGKVSVTSSGRQCQAWSAQSPNHHTMSTINYPDAGLGGHSFCRNPDGSSAPWCFTMDFPNVRREECSVGPRATACDPQHPSHAMPGGGAAPLARPVAGAPLELLLGQFADGELAELELRHYRVAIPADLPGIKVVLIPIKGDSDLFVSFSTPSPSRQSATWWRESIGVKQFSLARASPYFCASTAAATGLPTPLPPSTPCTLYLTVSGFEDGDYKLAAYPYNATENPQASSSASSSPAALAGGWSCSAGCDEQTLGNTVCDVPCNTSSCLWDQGDCGYYGDLEMDAICATGCPLAWTADGYCDEACFNAACDWDHGDCTAASHGCSDGCLPDWIDDDECDELCNNDECGWDGSDCDHGADECYTQADGSDYRGSIAITTGGLACQPWSHQSPHAHVHVHTAFPHAGLGGHNNCRNPGGVRPSPWCYTTSVAVEWQACTVPPPRPSCALKASSDPQRYRTLCPIDCAPLLANGACDLRCNISSCAYDEGDCGIGIDMATLIADQGYELVTPTSMYALAAAGVLVGLLVGLGVLRCVLNRLKRDELSRRGYSAEEMKGVDNYDPDDA